MVRQSDFLVVGSGIAGLSAALSLSAHGSVFLVTKGDSLEGSTNRAQGGIASAMAPTDSIELHIRDTLEAGAGLCRPEVVRILAENGPDTIRTLIDWGVRFTRQRENPEAWFPYHLALEGGHSHRRILHADDLTGAEIMRAMLEEARATPSIRFFESHLAIDLLREQAPSTAHPFGAGRCCGALVLDSEQRRVETFLARVVILATGGAGQVFQHTTAPSVSTGDGIAMAFRAGAPTEDMEFMQFHPTSLAHPQADCFLISEAVRGHGGILRNHRGEAFMEGEHPLKDLAPRDIVARAIDRQMKKHHLEHVWLDVTHLDEKELRFHFPNIFRKCREFGIRIEKQTIPVVPAAHYLCGGVKVNTSSESEIPGLFVCGEASCTGVHGANRLASNSLLESVVFSLRAAEAARAYLPLPHPAYPQEESYPPFGEIQGRWHNLEEQLRSTMWRKVGIVRTEPGLAEARREIDIIHREVEIAWNSGNPLDIQMVRLRNLTLVAGILIQSAQNRKESRGLHWFSDWPNTSEEFCRHLPIYPTDWFAKKP